MVVDSNQATVKRHGDFLCGN